MPASDPLGPRVYLGRRFARVLPTALVLALITTLLILVITPTNTFETTTYANLAALDAFTVVAPAARARFDAPLEAQLAAIPGIERAIPVRALWIRYPMLVGESFCALLLGGERDAQDLAGRAGVRLAAGRWPRAGAPEVAVHEQVARARRLELGSAFGTLVDPEDSTPGRFKVVGLLHGPARLAVGCPGTGMLADLVLARTPAFRLVYAAPGAKARVDAALRAGRDGEHPAFRVIDAAYMRERADRALRNLPLLTGVLSIATATVAALVAALLQRVAFQSRLPEFAVLLAMGHTRRRLVSVIASETALLAVLAWGVGLALGWGTLAWVVEALIEPRGLVVRLFDLRPVLASALVPAVSTLASVATLAHALGTLDPVAVLQGRDR